MSLNLKEAHATYVQYLKKPFLQYIRIYSPNLKARLRSSEYSTPKHNCESKVNTTPIQNNISNHD